MKSQKSSFAIMNETVKCRSRVSRGDRLLCVVYLPLPVMDISLSVWSSVHQCDCLLQAVPLTTALIPRPASCAWVGVSVKQTTKTNTKLFVRSDRSDQLHTAWCWSNESIVFNSPVTCLCFCIFRRPKEEGNIQCFKSYNQNRFSFTHIISLHCPSLSLTVCSHYSY